MNNQRKYLVHNKEQMEKYPERAASGFFLIVPQWLYDLAEERGELDKMQGCLVCPFVPAVSNIG